MKIEPYLFFEGRCEEALEFYKKALGAKVEGLMRVKESPEAPPPGMPPVPGEKIMHASFLVGESRLMASDGMAHGKPKFEGFSFAITAANEREADRWFGALAEGGQVRMPLGKTFFSPRFGMVADKFGVGWMVMTRPAG